MAPVARAIAVSVERLGKQRATFAGIGIILVSLGREHGVRGA